LASPSNANELLALKKIETYITNATHLIDEAEAMQTDGERYKFHYYANNAFIHNIPASLTPILLFDMVFWVIKTTLINQNKNNAPISVLKATTPSIL
jgi:hypothetical protein